MSDLRVHKVFLSELEIFFQTYTPLSSSVWPISPLRVQSYLHNPRALPADPVLYYIELDAKIIAFRTVWPDALMQNGEMQRFAWCSGNWVAPEHRRSGLSLRIFETVLSDWDHRLMFTNAAPESLAGYIKTGLFKSHCKRSGRRFYLNANLKNLMAQRKCGRIKSMFIILMDTLQKVPYHFKLLTFREYDLSAYEISEQEYFSSDFSFMEQNSLFMRKTPEFEWIFNYPWIEIGESSKHLYPFSWRVPQFAYRFVQIRKEGEVASWVILLRQGMLKLLYWHAENENMQQAMLQWLINYCYRQKIQALTLLDKDLVHGLGKMHKPFVASKRFENDIYATFDAAFDQAPIFDGDGDNIFT